MASIDVKISGLKELERKLLDMNEKVARKHLRGAVAAGAKVMKAAVVQNAPEDTGALKSNIYSKQVREESGMTRQTFYVGVRNGIARYANNAKNRRAGTAGKAYKDDGKTFYWRFLEFGTEKIVARPFIVPAFESTKENASQAIIDELAKRIDKEANR